MNTILLVAALAVAQSPGIVGGSHQRRADAWHDLSNVPGWQGYGYVNKNGWIDPERFRRVDDHSVTALPGARVDMVRAAPATQAACPVASGDCMGFVGWLNGVRAQHGLGPVSHDPALDGWCHQNNLAQAARGMGHWIMGTARRQNAAMGLGFPGVESAWMNSPGHRAALLDPTLRFVGIAWLGAYCTYCAN
jgi:hypothetical protein